MTALVVLPTASSGSVLSRTFSGKPAISAIPPALSVIGPKASIATIIPASDNIATAARATPYKPAKEKLTNIPREISNIGAKVDFIDKASPAIALVP